MVRMLTKKQVNTASKQFGNNLKRLIADKVEYGSKSLVKVSLDKLIEVAKIMGRVK